MLPALLAGGRALASSPLGKELGEGAMNAATQTLAGKGVEALLSKVTGGGDDSQQQQNKPIQY